jgi:hypothetical protein
MIAIYNLYIAIQIRLGHWLSLIFFICLFAQSCTQKDGKVTIVYKDNQAVGISIPKRVSDDDTNETPTGWQVKLKGNADAILGNYEIVDGSTVFTPVIPLTASSNYEVYYKNKLLATVHVPAPDPANAAYVVNLFPAVDTVPMNLLKIYVQFSAPMQQGESLRHIHLLNEQNDTVPNVFLDLQPELWDEKRTVLTVWLDPGRIKRSLIPNQQLGNPLQPGKHYTLAISNSWKDVQGLPLRQPYSKAFVAGIRDSISPQPQHWKLELPPANTTEGLGIKFGESLDYFLIAETIHILDDKGKIIQGKSGPLSNGTGYAFWPEKPWQPGQYTIRVAVELEDLAGNNLSRLFDRDLQVKAVDAYRDFAEKLFTIR